jgi:hypothetical protein
MDARKLQSYSRFEVGKGLLVQSKAIKRSLVFHQWMSGKVDVFI